MIILNGKRNLISTFTVVITGFVGGEEFDNDLDLALPENSMYLAVL